MGGEGEETGAADEHERARAVVKKKWWKKIWLTGAAEVDFFEGARAGVEKKKKMKKEKMRLTCAAEVDDFYRARAVIGHYQQILRFDVPGWVNDVSKETY